MLALSLGLIMFGWESSGILCATGVILLPFSICWPIGYLFGGASGAIVGGFCGSLALVAGFMSLLGEISRR